MMTTEQRLAAFMRAFYKAAQEPGGFELDVRIGEYDTDPPLQTLRYRLGKDEVELTPEETMRLALAIMHIGQKLDGEAGQIWEAVCNGFARELIQLVRKYCAGPTLH